MPATPDTPRPSLGRIALGLFVIVQFCALFAANVLAYREPARTASSSIQPPRPGDIAGTLRFVADRYCEATGQPQGWAMFEAGYMYNSVAWDIRIEWGDGRVARVQGVAGLPGDTQVWRPPAYLNRRFVYESSLLGMDLILPEAGFEIAEPMIEDVRLNNGIYDAFFRSVYNREKRHHTDWPAQPKWMELTILRARTVNPMTGVVYLPQVRYVARWRSASDATECPVQAYDLTQPDEPYRSFPKP